jgi:hypothetical protein
VAVATATSRRDLEVNGARVAAALEELLAR